MASKIPRANASSASSSSIGNQQSTPLQEGAMKRPAAAMDPDMEPEVIEWDDPENHLFVVPFCCSVYEGLMWEARRRDTRMSRPGGSGWVSE